MLCIVSFKENLDNSWVPGNLAAKLFFFCLVYLGVLALPVRAETIAQQTQDYSANLNAWQGVQELGTNLSGILSTFTFRVNTSQTNLTQFDFTTQNSRVYDKTTGTFAIGCSPANAQTDKLRGLEFNTVNVPGGFEDVTIDFSCRNYVLTPGHKYLIIISNANMGNSVAGLIRFAGASYLNKPSTDYFPNAGLRYGGDRTFCDAQSYFYASSQNPDHGCSIFITAKDDLYFVLNNNSPPAPPPKIPVIFIPGIGGSELKLAQKGEVVWVNNNEAVKLGSDDYFDILKLKPDGKTPEAPLSLTGNLTPQGYGDIESFFTSLGYVKDTNFFIFPYDWRFDVATTKDALDVLIEKAKQKSGQTQVNIIAHSMGGLVARNYIADSAKAGKVNSLIEMGVPHLGAPWAIKALFYGAPLGPSYLFDLIALNPDEVKDVIQNLTSHFQLLPNKNYFNFYENSSATKPFPFFDERDVDQDHTTGALNYAQTKSLLTNLKFNINLFTLAEDFHTGLNNQTNGVKLYFIVGSGQPTLGQIREGWWINWPIELIPKYDEVYVNGDGTVPMFSASLINDTQNLSGGAKIYYVEQDHSDLVNKSGAGMQAVKAILNTETIPDTVKSEKIALEGKQISLNQNMSLDIYDGNIHTGLNSNGEVESNIPGVFFSVIGNSKSAFIKKSTKPLTIRITPQTADKKTATLKFKDYSQDAVTKTTALMLDTNISSPSAITIDPQIISAQGSTQDQTAPVTKLDSSSGTITLSATDTTGIYQTQYSLDSGKTVQVYTQPITIATPGDYTLQYFSTDNLGNQELPQTYKFSITANPTTNSSSNTSSGSGSNSAGVTSTPSPSSSPQVILNISESKNSEVLGAVTQNSQNETPKSNAQPDNKQITTAMSPITKVVIGLATVGAIAGAGLALSFLKPPPR